MASPDSGGDPASSSSPSRSPQPSSPDAAARTASDAWRRLLSPPKPAAKKPLPPAKRPRPSSKPKPKQPGASKDDPTEGPDARSFLKNPYTEGHGLPILTEPQSMFDDMIERLTDGGAKAEEVLLPLLDTAQHRPIRVATMCSGTESPILALDMIQKAIARFCEQPTLAEALNDRGISTILPIEHVFSCEIEPFKQAYIERNFHPPTLFRDIRELKWDNAYTAFGSLVEVPGEGSVDILIAGTSCVDYSNLNTKKVRDTHNPLWETETVGFPSALTSLTPQ